MRANDIDNRDIDTRPARPVTDDRIDNRFGSYRIVIYRMTVAAICWFALAVQGWFFIGFGPGGGPLARTLNFFSYFTILSNLMAALAMTLPWLAPRTSATALFARTGVRTAIAVYMIVVGAVYVLVLRNLWQPHGLLRLADALLHYAIPVLYFIDWLFIPKHALRLRQCFSQAFVWLMFPLAYAVWTLAHGAATGFYPYPFLDVDDLGYAEVIVNIIGLGVVFMVLGMGLSGVKAVIGRKAQPVGRISEA